MSGTGQIERAAAWIEADAPVIWLLGKTQAGKTSIVAELTGQARDQIGNGFEPFTAHSRLYAFPEQRPVLRFLDTRGLADTAVDAPFDDLRAAESQAHVLLLVARAEDQALDELLVLARKLRRAHPGWPLIVAQSALHQLYSSGRGHILPYPYTGTEADFALATVPDVLLRALRAQRLLFTELPGTAPVFVPLDFTRPEQGLAPLDYGASALWEALEHLLPEVVADLKTAACQPGEEGRRRRLILPWALAAASANAVPVPVLGGLGSASLQAAMVAQIARAAGRDSSRDAWKELLSTLGGGFALGYGGSWLAQQVLKLGIGWGSALTASWTFALTWAIGEVAMLLFAEQAAGRTPDREALRAHYRAAYKSALQRARGEEGLGR
ncbi:GTPase [Thiorhodovibrio winogradskyi]|uniref:GTPase n=1 Tax=Thiorhodovibrio winogradskyi TaxID=77007 RepID=A0ABZ0S3Z7_9GAMM|nr:GTPase [Thiorhodovibrio winogradskyi]